jgi:glycine hydroxymethyltransferase
MSEAMAAQGFDIVSGGTDNHLFLVNLIGRELTGKDAEALLGEVNITVNKNTVPGEPRSPFVTSGLRIGTPACTTRGFNADDCRQLGNMISERLLQPKSAAVAQRVRAAAADLCQRYPVYRRLDKVA